MIGVPDQREKATVILVWSKKEAGTDGGEWGMDRMGKRNTEVQKEQCSKIACPRLAEITIILSAIQNFISGISCEVKGSDIPPKRF